jgi:hypothetical protein
MREGTDERKGLVTVRDLITDFAKRTIEQD